MSTEFTPRERRLIARLTTPARVQAYLNRLPYNYEPRGATLRGFRGVVHHGQAHCLEAALFAAVVLEQHGFAPRVISFESADKLDHVIYVYQIDGRWGSIARSRDPGLNGRRPVFRSARALAASYVDPYVDYTGRVLGFAVVNVAEQMGDYDWRLSSRNVWKVEQMLIDYPHQRLGMSDARYARLLAKYTAFRAANDDRKPVLYYSGRDAWEPLPHDPTWERHRR
ncbi:MAG: hypothetical protein QM736_26665 [Vicinamibacterales bacterium]